MARISIKKIALVFLLFISVLVISPALSFAQQEQNVQEVVTKYPLLCGSAETLEQCFPRLFNLIFIVAGVFAMGLLVYWGYLYMTAGGNGQQAETAKKGLTGLIQGVLLLAIAFIFLQFLSPRFTNVQNPVNNVGGNQQTASGTIYFNFTSPNQNATVSGFQTVSVNITGINPSDIDRVRFIVQPDNRSHEDNTSPYSYVWDTTAVSNGVKVLSAAVYDKSGNSVKQAVVTVNVSN